MRSHRKFLSLTFVFPFVALVLSGCGSEEASPDTAPTASVPGETAPDAEVAPDASPYDALPDVQPFDPGAVAPPAPRRKQNYYPEVVIKTTHGDIKVKLNAKDAPRTVENFLDNYVALNFYDGTIFHYTLDGVMVVGGGFTKDLEEMETRGQLYNEADNGLKNVAGTIAMYRYPDAAHSASSQFLINISDNVALDHQSTESSEEYGYCVFGEIVEGLDVVQSIAAATVEDKEGFPSTPVEPVVIETIERIK